MKDYYDLWAIPRSLKIAPEELDAAIAATFDRRKTSIPAARPPGLSAAMLEDGGKQRQWRAYAASLELVELELSAVMDAAWELVGPSCKRLTDKAV